MVVAHNLKKTGCIGVLINYIHIYSRVFVCVFLYDQLSYFTLKHYEHFIKQIQIYFRHTYEFVHV